MKFIPQIEPWIDETELDELTEVIRSTYITENRKTEEFVRKVEELTQSKHAIAMSNGTLAIVAALLASGVGPGDEVLIPDLTFIASSNAVLLVGATPVFVDIDRVSGCLDVNAAEVAITKQTKAIMPVHLYGQMVDMDKLMAMAERHNLIVVEDAAEAFGVTYKGRHAGTFGRFGTFSFFANKTITCGEGGIVLCQNQDDYKQLYRIKNHGRDQKGIFIHESIGFNFCFTDLQAAIGVAQLRKFERIMAGKARVMDRYRDLLAGVQGVTLMEPPAEVRSNYWFINILLEDPGGLSNYLAEQKIATRRLFYPLHMQPCYADRPKGNCPNSRWLYETGLSLPSAPHLVDEDIVRVCEQVRAYVSVS